jgi:DNA polymerase III delta subunit
LKVFDLTSDVIKKHNIFFLYDHDSCISNHSLQEIKFNFDIKSLSTEINETYLEDELNQYLSSDLFGERYLIIINIKNVKNILKINALLKENTSDNIFIIKYQKKDMFKFDELSKSLFIDTEIKEFEKNKYLSYLIKSYELDLTSEEIDTIEITTANNYLALHNILKLKTLTSKNHIGNHSTYEGFDIIASIFNDKQEIFTHKIDKFLQSLSDPIQFNSLLFWFFKSVYRHKNNSRINLKNLRLFGNLSKFCLVASSKMSHKLLENIIQKIHLVDKISKGQYIDLDAKLEIKKILHISFLKLRHG